MTDEPDPVESISAVTLLTADMGRAVAFYRTLGFRLLYGGEDAAFTSFRVGPGYLNLQLDPVPSLPAPGLGPSGVLGRGRRRHVPAEPGRPGSICKRRPPTPPGVSATSTSAIPTATS